MAYAGDATSLRRVWWYGVMSYAGRRTGSEEFSGSLQRNFPSTEFALAKGKCFEARLEYFNGPFLYVLRSIDVL